MLERLPQYVSAQQVGVVTVAGVLHRDGGGADHAGACDTAGNSQRDDHLRNAISHHRHHDEKQQHLRDAAEGVHDPLYDKIEPAADHRREHADDEGQHRGQQCAAHAQDHRGPGAVDHITQKIHAQSVRSQQMRRIFKGLLQSCANVHRQIAVHHGRWRDNIGKDRHQQKQYQDHKTDAADGLFSEEVFQ